MFHIIEMRANTGNSTQGAFRAGDEAYWQVVPDRARLLVILQGAIMIPSDGSGRLMFGE